MIKLTNITVTDTVGQLRGQINTMQNEIMADQPMIGRCLNPTVNLYMNEQLAGAITASDMQACWLSALIFPENNECFVAGIIGHCKWLGEGTNVIPPDVMFNKLVIDIPTIQAPNGTNYTSFLPPSHLSLPYNLSGTTQQFFIGVNGMHRIKRTYTSPFDTACIETDANMPNTLNVAVTSAYGISATTDSVLTLNF